MKVGIIGLITADVAHIAATGGLKAAPYEETLRKYVPEMRAHGAQVIIVLAHVPMKELAELAHKVCDLQIPLMLGGHSHELDQMQVKDTPTWVVNSGCWWRAYSRIDLDYQPQTGTTVLLASKQVCLQQEQPQADREVKAIIDRWQARMGAEYGQDLGFTASGITRPLAMADMMGACYLGMDPGADAVLFNNGGFRQDITPGGLNKGVVISVLPFTNRLYRITLTGQQLLDFHAPESGVIYGLRREGAQVMLMKTGQPVDPGTSYHLLVTDYLYNKSPELRAADPQPVTTAQDYRQPVYDWLARHPSSTTRPLESIIDLKTPVLEVGGRLTEYVPALRIVSSEAHNLHLLTSSPYFVSYLKYLIYQSTM